MAKKGFAWGGRFVWMWDSCSENHKKNGTFPLIQRMSSTKCLAVYLKEKGKCLPHTLRQKYRHYFWQPWHALHFGSLILIFLPKDSSQKKCFVLFLIFCFQPRFKHKFCSDHVFFVFVFCFLATPNLHWPKVRLHFNTLW